MEDKKDKRVLRVELDDEVKRVSITGLGSDEKVVMRRELNEDELEMVTGGAGCEIYHEFEYISEDGRLVSSFCTLNKVNASENTILEEAAGNSRSITNEKLDKCGKTTSQLTICPIHL